MNEQETPLPKEPATLAEALAELRICHLDRKRAIEVAMATQARNRQLEMQWVRLRKASKWVKQQRRSVD